MTFPKQNVEKQRAGSKSTRRTAFKKHTISECNYESFHSRESEINQHFNKR